MRGALTTSNVLEVAYLLSRGHQIQGVEPGVAGAYGIRDLGVMIAGPDIDLDHRNFLCHGTASRRELSLALQAMARALEAEVGP
jgi:hypothetical protein